MSNTTARAVSTVGIWLGVAVSLAAGAFQRTWTGDFAVFILFLIVAAVCGAAALSTAAVWRETGKSDETPSLHRAAATAEPEPAADRDRSSAFREK